VKELLAALFLLTAAVAAHAQALPAPAPVIEEVYLARDDGYGKAGEQVTEFRTTDVPIYCVILLDSDLRTVVKMNFVAVAVAGVKPETKVVSASYTTAAGQNRVNFTGRPDGRWTPGRYRVDLFLNGKITRHVEFEIKRPAGAGTDIRASGPRTPGPAKRAANPAAKTTIKIVP
jgi:hypothetical protein